MEASFLRYRSKLTTKSIIPSWCMIETSSAQSLVCMSQAMCLTVGVMELWVVKGEFTITPRHSTCRYISLVQGFKGAAVVEVMIKWDGEVGVGDCGGKGSMFSRGWE